MISITFKKWCCKIKNIILGIDGGCFEGIKHLLRKNALPNLKMLIEEGFSSTLIETIPPVTIPSWPCLFSGLTPEQLGYCWFDHPEKGLFNSYIWRDKSIFSIRKLKVFVLNVPGTFPAWEINGEMITGMMSPSINTFPPNLKNKINKNWIIDGKTIPDIFKAFNIKKNLFLEKLNQNFNIYIYVIRLPDSISHHSHLDTKYILKYLDYGYKKIDNFLGEIIKNYDFDNILIFSDHGLKFYNYEFNISRWLEKKRLLFINKSSKQKAFSLITKSYDFFRPFLKINYQIYNKIKKRFLNEHKKTDNLNNKEVSKAHSYFSNVGGIFLGNKDKIKKKLIINSLKQENKIESVIEPNIIGFPDLFIILNEKYLFNSKSSYFVIRRRNSINHTDNGFFIAYGKNIKKGKTKMISYLKIAPTILKLNRYPIPDHMQSRPLDIIEFD